MSVCSRVKSQNYLKSRFRHSVLESSEILERILVDDTEYST